MCDLHSLPAIKEADLKKIPKRLKLWELNVHWHCAIIGTCLTPGELEKLGKKCKAPKYEGRSGEYKLHSYMVNMARHGQGGGRVIHKFLERKYQRVVKSFARAKTNQAVEDMWRTAFDVGDIAGAFWAVMTHEASSIDLQGLVYGEVHMLSHLEGATNRADHQKISELLKTIERLQFELHDIKKSNNKAMDKRDAIIGELKTELRDVQAKAARSDELEALLLAERDGASMARLENRIDCLTARVIQETDRADVTQARLIEMETKYKEAQAEIRLKDQLYEELSLSVMDSRTTGCFAEEGCPGEGDLCGRCIAYIGGQTKQAAFFRDYVEKKNGQFLHHDGGLHDGQARLQSILAQADAVMFPVTCVSHEATREIKRVCMKQDKPFVPLRSQGLSAFTKGLEETIEKM